RISQSPRQGPVRGMLMPPAALPVAVALFLIGCTGPNVLLALLSVLVLLVGCMLLWRPGEPPILLFTFAFPWVQGSTAIYHANWLNLDVADYALFPGDMHSAIALSLLGLLALAVGMRLGAGPRHKEDPPAAHSLALSQPVKRWFWLYALSWMMS